ncbi:MAG: 3-hydroxy-2-methylbutyryl-CoA dehydrogenase [Spirochaetes bacterium RBG_16_49_21]|nr:MAG: 3-hydroxy-2-methylbutyryl-CoA dehydrogenase [Spirochaetes bacterium RBG_16_49_21]
MKISDVRAIVTGGASGLGEGVVRALISNGGKAAIFDLDDEKGKKLEKELGESVVYQKTDVTSETDISNALRASIKKFGKINVAVNCAGITIAGRTTGKNGPMPLPDFEKVIRINLVGTFNVARLFAAEISNNTPGPDGERGVIINTASVAAFDGQIGQAAYAASKSGIVGMTLPIARDLASLGIRNVTIAPGLFDTPMMASLPENVRISLGQSVPFPSRLGRPDEFALMVLSIIENTMINGETIRLDGALRMAPK